MLSSATIQIGGKSREYVTEEMMKAEGIEDPYEFFATKEYKNGAMLFIPDKGYYVKTNDGVTESLERQEAESLSWSAGD